MAQRWCGARHKTQMRGIPVEFPEPKPLGGKRLGSVAVRDLPHFNEGYSATAGGAVCDTSVRRSDPGLGDLMLKLAPNDAEWRRAAGADATSTIPGAKARLKR